MTGVSFNVEIDDAAIQRELKRKLSKLDNLGPFYEAVGDLALNWVQDRFDTETAPDGSSWQALAPSTLKNRLGKNGSGALTILRDRGIFVETFNKEFNSHQVRIGTGAVQGAIQHFGGKTGRNHATTIPARPILGIPTGGERELIETAEVFLSN